MDPLEGSSPLQQRHCMEENSRVVEAVGDLARHCIENVEGLPGFQHRKKPQKTSQLLPVQMSYRNCCMLTRDVYSALRLPEHATSELWNVCKSLKPSHMMLPSCARKSGRETTNNAGYMVKLLKSISKSTAILAVGTAFLNDEVSGRSEKQNKQRLKQDLAARCWQTGGWVPRLTWQKRIHRPSRVQSTQMAASGNTGVLFWSPYMRDRIILGVYFGVLS